MVHYQCLIAANLDKRRIISGSILHWLSLIYARYPRCGVVCNL